MGSKADKIVSRALYRVVTRSMAAGRSVEYQQLLAETEDELAVLLVRRLEREARLLRHAQDLIREARVQLAAAEQARTEGPGDVDREFRSLDVARSGLDEGPAGLPLWHPEHALNPENDL